MGRNEVSREDRVMFAALDHLHALVKAAEYGAVTNVESLGAMALVFGKPQGSAWVQSEKTAGKDWDLVTKLMKGDALARTQQFYVEAWRQVKITILSRLHVYSASNISDGHSGEARRVDGEPFPALGRLQERKSHSTGQGVKSWPMGLTPPKFDEEAIAIRNPRILLVEGSPDYVAACHLCMEIPEKAILPAAMLGKGAKIADHALRHFKGRRVTIAGHSDARERVQEWAMQIRRAKAESVLIVLLENYFDVNDWIRYHPGRVGELISLLALDK
jgi:hypothetical protein